MYFFDAEVGDKNARNKNNLKNRRPMKWGWNVVDTEN